MAGSLKVAHSINRERDLWENMKSGNKNALERIYDQNAPSLISYGRQMTPNSALVDDCIQELFVDIWLKRDRLSSTSSIRFYLLKALKLRILRALEKDKKNQYINDFPPFFFESLSNLKPEDPDNELEQQLHKALLSLSEVQREIIYLKFYNKLSFAEIEDLLSLTRKQLYNAISKAMAKMRDLISVVFLLLLNS